MGGGALRLFKFSPFLILLLLLAGCVKTTGDIKENRFNVENDFSVGLLDNDWEVVHQKVNPLVQPNAAVQRENTPWQISFSHKKSNGFVGAGSWELNEVGQALPLDVWADGLVANSGGLKLSERSVKIDGNDAIELVISGKYMSK
jgi:hypothetical protein